MASSVWKSSTVVRLGLINAVGYSSSGAVPFWISTVSGRYDLPIWSGALIATLQLICTAIMNIASPWLFRNRSKTAVGAAASAVAVGGNLIAILPGPICFVAGCALAGGGLGVLLNTTNRLAAETESAGRAYSIYEIVGVMFSMSLYLTIPYLVGKFGFNAVFILLSAVAAAACAEFLAIPVPRAAPVSAPVASSAKDFLAGGALFTRMMALVAMFLMFVGQSSISNSLVPLGRRVAIDMQTVGQIMAIGLVASLAGGFLARALAGRLGVVAPIVGGALALAIDAVMVTNTTSAPVYIAFAIFYFVCIVFITPFAFAVLAKVDASGRTASVGPAFLMIGVAMGPSVGAFATAVAGMFAIGWISAGALAVSVTLFVLASARSGADHGALAV